MHHEHDHTFSVIDFETTEHQTTFVQFTCFDAVLEKTFSGEVKFVGGRPYGDIVHPERSSMSTECREFVQEMLLVKYEAGEFS